MSEPVRKENKVVTDRAIKVIRAVMATDSKLTTQNLIAEQLGVSKQTLSKWMGGESFITIRDFSRICLPTFAKTVLYEVPIYLR